MPGYPKIWTCILREPWWFYLSGIDRGVLLQLYLLAKDQADNGQVLVTSVANLALVCAVKRRTLDRALTKLQELGALTVDKSTKGVVVITIRNYLKWQKMTAKEVVGYLRKTAANLPTVQPTTKPNQTIATIEADAEAIVKIYHQKCPSLPRVRKIDGARQFLIRTAAKDIDSFEDFFARCEKSDWIKSKVREKWMDFEWILRDRIKILEGKRDNQPEAVDRRPADVPR